MYKSVNTVDYQLSVYEVSIECQIDMPIECWPCNDQDVDHVDQDVDHGSIEGIDQHSTAAS